MLMRGSMRGFSGGAACGSDRTSARNGRVSLSPARQAQVARDGAAVRLVLRAVTLGEPRLLDEGRREEPQRDRGAADCREQRAAQQHERRQVEADGDVLWVARPAIGAAAREAAPEAERGLRA